MEMLLVGLGLVAASAAVSALLLFGVKPQPVTDPAAPLGIPEAELGETLGRWRLRRSQFNAAGWLARLRALVLTFLVLLGVLAAVAMVAAVVAFALSFVVSNALKSS